jgi:hypothetical protein
MVDGPNPQMGLLLKTSAALGSNAAASTFANPDPAPPEKA